ncbi:ISXO2 transposase-like protein [Methylosinus sp. sav-2]|nr:ISXO2 transposase-like protein [Methylosinus sp. sav-2]
MQSVKAFSKAELRKLAGATLESGADIVSDGLNCFAAAMDVGCTHTAIVTGPGAKAAKTPAFKWVNTALGNIKAAIVGTYRAVGEKHVPRYVAEFEYRFNRRGYSGAPVVVPHEALASEQSAVLRRRRSAARASSVMIREDDQFRRVRSRASLTTSIWRSIWPLASAASTHSISG